MTQPLTERLRELLAKCSKGPWTIGRRSKFKLAIDAPHSRHEWTALAKVVVAMEDIDGIATPSKEGEANAELTALAPDMAQRIIALEATQAELVEALKECGETLSNFAYSQGQALGMIDIVLAKLEQQP